MIESFTDPYAGQAGSGSQHDNSILSIDVSPLQKLLISLATQVRQTQMPGSQRHPSVQTREEVDTEAEVERLEYGMLTFAWVAHLLWAAG